MSATDQFIELDRRFTEYTPDESPERLAERSYLAAFQGKEPGISWDELLQHRLVVILGEPGSGKTLELRAQQQKHRLSHFFYLWIDWLLKMCPTFSTITKCVGSTHGNPNPTMRHSFWTQSTNPN